MDKIAPSLRHLAVTSIAEGIGDGFSRLDYRGKRWTIKHQGREYPITRADDNTPSAFVDVIILAASPYQSQVLFPPWKGDAEAAGKAPICASLHGDMPDPGVPQPQSQTCATCRHKEWITKPSGQRGTECQTHKRLAIMLMPAMTKRIIGAEMTEPIYFKVPPGSFKSLKAYSNELQGKSYPPPAVVTRLGFSLDKQFEITFKIAKVLEEEATGPLLELLESPRVQTIIGNPTLPRIAAPAPAEDPVEDEGFVQALRPQPQSQVVRPQPVIEATPTPVEQRNTYTVDEEGGSLDEKIADALSRKLEGMMPN